MNINNLENNNKIELENNLIKSKEQNNFLETTLGKTINTAIDIGIRTLLPDFVENQIINVKDNLLNYGLKDGISKTIEDAINLGKSAIGIFTGNFENMSQVQSAVENGGLIDGMSSLLDLVIDKTKESGILNKNIANTLKQGKNVILNNVENNIEKTFTNQLKGIDNIEKTIINWKENFGNNNFNGMEKEYKKIEKELRNLIPLENIIKQAREIQNIHTLIKNNGQNFNLSNEQLELIKKLG